MTNKVNTLSNFAMERLESLKKLMESFAKDKILTKEDSKFIGVFNLTILNPCWVPFAAHLDISDTCRSYDNHELRRVLKRVFYLHFFHNMYIFLVEHALLDKPAF